MTHDKGKGGDIETASIDSLRDEKHQHQDPSTPEHLTLKQRLQDFTFVWDAFKISTGGVAFTLSVTANWVSGFTGLGTVIFGPNCFYLRLSPIRLMHVLLYIRELSRMLSPMLTRRLALAFLYMESVRILPLQVHTAIFLIRVHWWSFSQEVPNTSLVRRVLLVHIASDIKLS
jgi:hypothetical protein